MSVPPSVPAGTILVVDDTPANIGVLLGLLGEAGHRVLVATDGESALEQIRYSEPDLILLDVMMPGIDGFEVCRRLNADPARQHIPVIFLTALDQSEEMLRGFQAGAADYVAKPLRHAEVMARVDVHLALQATRRALGELNRTLEQKIDARTSELQACVVEIAALKNRLQEENSYLRAEIAGEREGRGLVGDSAALKQVLHLVNRVAATTSTVLITGETGVGKELIARAVHEASPRAARPMIRLNCAAIAAGLVESELFGHTKGAFTGASDKRLGRFELANGGTLFLDEVSELPLETQVKLLRVLQEREFEPVGSSRTQQVDVRLIAASNRDLPSEVAAGKFRADLYHRLNVFPIEVPPLRERRADIPLLAQHFLARHARGLGKVLRGFDETSMCRLVEHDWPGNIRELQNVIERAAILAQGERVEIDDQILMVHARGLVQPQHLAPLAAPRQEPTAEVATLADVQRSHIIAVLRKTGGVIEGEDGAARLLNMKPSTARYRIRKLGITRESYR